MFSGIRRHVAVAFAGVILCLHDDAPSSSSVTVANASTSSCHGQHCQNSDGSHHRTSLSASSGKIDHRQRNLASPVYEAYYENEVETWLNSRRSEIENSVFISYDSNGVPYQSTAYVYDDFINALRSMSVNGLGGGDNSVFFYIGQTDGKGVVHGLVNVAAFLSREMLVLGGER